MAAQDVENICNSRGLTLNEVSYATSLGGKGIAEKTEWAVYRGQKIEWWATKHHFLDSNRRLPHQFTPIVVTCTQPTQCQFYQQSAKDGEGVCIEIIDWY